MASSTINQYFGWKPDLPDHRDFYFSSFRTPQSVAPSVDLRSSCPTPFNQFQLGSCTANAVAGAIKFNQTKQKFPVQFTPSRLFIYYNTRSLEGTINVDSGASLRNTVKSVNKWGAPPESFWEYDQSKFAIRPPTAAFTKGTLHKALVYQRVNQDIGAMQTCLSDGFPFVFGFSVYQSFESGAVTATGVVPMPTVQEFSLGGHAVMAVGYNASAVDVNGIPPRHFVCRNSWGPSWGAKGYFYMPFEYLLNSDLSADFWTIRQVS